MDMALHPTFGFADGPAFAESDGDSARALRPLGWAELCARLVASQDFRSAHEAQGNKVARQASFHGSAAQWLARVNHPAQGRAAQAPGSFETAVEHEIPVNPNPSVVGKSGAGIALFEAGGATPSAPAHRTEPEMFA